MQVLGCTLQEPTTNTPTGRRELEQTEAGRRLLRRLKCGCTLQGAAAAAFYRLQKKENFLGF